MLWLLAIFASSLIIRYYFFNRLSLNLLQTSLQIGLVVLLHWTSQRFIKQLEQGALSEEHTSSLDKTTVIALARLAKIIAAIIGLIMLIYTVNGDVHALLAMGSAGTIVVGIAAKDLLANFFGGFMLFIDRPFSVGDMIRADDKDIEGIVQHIGWRRTQILTREQRPLYIPNSLFLSMGIENASRAKHHSINAVINLKGLSVKEINEVLAAIERMLRLQRDIDQSMPVSASVKHFDSTGFYIKIYCFTKGYNLASSLKVQQDIFLGIAKIVDKMSIVDNPLADRKIIELSRL
jgi:MscS family membrane protein